MSVKRIFLIRYSNMPRSACENFSAVLFYASMHQAVSDVSLLR